MEPRAGTRGMIAAAIGALMLAAPVASANEGWGHAKKDPAEYVEHLDKKLELTDEQRASIQPIVSEYGERAKGLKEQLMSLRKEKHDKIRAQLTPEQAEKFDKMSEKHEKKEKPND
jgi:Spy/CpxP family protein refolding chaperone